MQVYGYDKKGFYTHSWAADESPLEPGEFLIPASSTTHAPPERESGKLQHFGPSGWTLVDAEVEVITQVVAEDDQTPSERLPRALVDVENAAMAARSAIVGDPTKALEYFAAEREAREFLADSTRSAGASVQAWADACEKDCAWAAEDIVRAADSAAKGLAIVRAARLRAREDLKTLVGADASLEDFEEALADALQNVEHAVMLDQQRVDSAENAARVDAENAEHLAELEKAQAEAEA